MLLTQRQWNKYISNLTRKCDKRLIKPLQTKHQRVERHFATNYENSQGVVELASQPVASWVSVDEWEDLATLCLGDEKINIDNLIDVTPLVELESGETLSDREAIDGLGAFLPELAEPRKEEVRNEWTNYVSSARAGAAHNTGNACEEQAPSGEGGVSHRGRESGIRRSPYRAG